MSNLFRGAEWIMSKLFKENNPELQPHIEVIVKEINFYKSQLPFPEENIHYETWFSKELQKSMSRFNEVLKIKESDFITWLKTFDTDGEDVGESSKVVADDEKEKFKVSYKFVSRCLFNILDIMKKISIEILRENPGIQI